MPQKSKGPRLYLHKRANRPAVYHIRDGTNMKSTGFGEDEQEAARAALAVYIKKVRPTLPRSWTGECSRQPRDVTVYFISTNAVPDYPIKIGVSFGSVPARLADLQVANPYPLTILACEEGCGPLERLIHADFHSARLQGEWFRRTPELMEYIRRLSTEAA